MVSLGRCPDYCIIYTVLGDLEATIMNSHTRGANLRQWLRRPECSEIVQQFKCLFDKAFSSKNPSDRNIEQNARHSERAHYNHNGVVFSRASTHLGNSLILYYPPLSTTAIVGSIQKIEASGEEAFFWVKRQAPLSSNKYDPFCRYTSFPAKVYSSLMDNGPEDRIRPQAVVSHIARFEFSSERAVILNLSRVCFFNVLLDVLIMKSRIDIVIRRVFGKLEAGQRTDFF